MSWPKIHLLLNGDIIPFHILTQPSLLQSVPHVGSPFHSADFQEWKLSEEWGWMNKLWVSFPLSSCMPSGSKDSCPRLTTVGAVHPVIRGHRTRAYSGTPDKDLICKGHLERWKSVCVHLFSVNVLKLSFLKRIFVILKTVMAECNGKREFGAECNLKMC